MLQCRNHTMPSCLGSLKAVEIGLMAQYSATPATQPRFPHSNSHAVIQATAAWSLPPSADRAPGHARLAGGSRLHRSQPEPLLHPISVRRK